MYLLSTDSCWRSRRSGVSLPVAAGTVAYCGVAGVTYALSGKKQIVVAKTPLVMAKQQAQLRNTEGRHSKFKTRELAIPR